MILRASEGVVQLEVTLPENPKIREVVRESLQAILDALDEDDSEKPKLALVRSPIPNKHKGKDHKDGSSSG